MDGINAVRVLMPRIWFDAARCHEGIEALRQYHCEYDEKKRALNDKPYHNFASHPADAFRYLAVAYKELAPAPRAPVVSTERFIAPPYEMPPGEHRICIDLSDMSYDDYEEIGRRRMKERA
jgi:hypothetical protein